MGERTLAGTARQASGPGQKSGQPRPIYSAQFAGTSWTWASLPPPLVAAGSWSMLASMEGTAAETPRRAVGPKQSSSPSGSAPCLPCCFAVAGTRRHHGVHASFLHVCLCVVVCTRPAIDRVFVQACVALGSGRTGRFGAKAQLGPPTNSKLYKNIVNKFKK